MYKKCKTLLSLVFAAFIVFSNANIPMNLQASTDARSEQTQKQVGYDQNGNAISEQELYNKLNNQSQTILDEAQVNDQVGKAEELSRKVDHSLSVEEASSDLICADTREVLYTYNKQDRKPIDLVIVQDASGSLATTKSWGKAVDGVSRIMDLLDFNKDRVQVTTYQGGGQVSFIARTKYFVDHVSQQDGSFWFRTLGVGRGVLATQTYLGIERTGFSRKDMGIPLWNPAGLASIFSSPLIVKTSPLVGNKGWAMANLRATLPTGATPTSIGILQAKLQYQLTRKTLGLFGDNKARETIFLVMTDGGANVGIANDHYTAARVEKPGSGFLWWRQPGKLFQKGDSIYNFPLDDAAHQAQKVKNLGYRVNVGFYKNYGISDAANRPGAKLNETIYKPANGLPVAYPSYDSDLLPMILDRSMKTWSSNDGIYLPAFDSTQTSFEDFLKEMENQMRKQIVTADFALTVNDGNLENIQMIPDSFEIVEQPSGTTTQPTVDYTNGTANWNLKYEPNGTYKVKFKVATKRSGTYNVKASANYDTSSDVILEIYTTNLRNCPLTPTKQVSNAEGEELSDEKLVLTTNADDFYFYVHYKNDGEVLDWNNVVLQDTINSDLVISDYWLADTTGLSTGSEYLNANKVTSYVDNTSGNNISLNLTKEDESYQYIANKTLTLVVKGKLRPGMTLAELEAIIAQGGVPNVGQSVVTYNRADGSEISTTLDSNEVRVVPILEKAAEISKTVFEQQNATAYRGALIDYQVYVSMPEPITAQSSLTISDTLSKFFLVDRLTGDVPNAKVYEVTDTGEVEVTTVAINAEKRGVEDVLTVDFLKGTNGDFSDYAGKKYVVRFKVKLDAQAIADNEREFNRLNTGAGIPNTATILLDNNVLLTSNPVYIKEPTNEKNAEKLEINTTIDSKNQYTLKMKMPTSLDNVTHLEIMDDINSYLGVEGVQLYDVTSGTREEVPATDATISYELETSGQYAGQYVVRINFIPENGSYEKYENKIYEVDYQVFVRSVIPEGTELRNIGYLVMDDVIAQTNENIVVAKGK